MTYISIDCSYCFLVYALAILEGSEQIFPRKRSLGAPVRGPAPYKNQTKDFLESLIYRFSKG